MYRRLILFFAASFIGLGLFSQARIGFTNLNGFPSVIVNNGSYTVSGFIKNTGSDSLFTGVDIEMSVNNGPTLTIQNNVPLAAPLAPGDSIFWSKGGHSFPGGQFAPGNNDVLIWPTRMQGPGSAAESDSSLKNMFYAGSAAFMLTGPLGGVDQAIPLRAPVTLNVYAKNVGAKRNKNQLRVYMSFDGGTPVVIAEVNEQYQPDDAFSIDVSDFSLNSYLELMNVSTFQAMFGQLSFWVAEKNGMEPVTTIGYPITAFGTGFYGKMAGRTGIYPNPVHHDLNISYDDQNRKDVTSVRLFNLNGQLLREYDGAVQRIPVEDLAAGQYFIQIQAGSNARVHPFIKE